MPENLQHHVRAIADTVHVDLASSARVPDSNATLVVLTHAAQARQRVHLRYTAEDGRHTERSFDPYGLAWWSGAWYALGMCHLRQALRSFRLDRMREVVLLDDYFARPAGFDALETLTHAIGRIPRKHAIEVLLRADLLAARQVFPAAFGVLEPVDGGTLLRSGAGDLDWFARQLARVSFDFDIRRPDGLREALKRHAQRLQRRAKRS
jgi:predicted DNA-binding transcriptional regulator YafY